MRKTKLWNNEQGQNWLDGGAPFYNVYKSKNGVFYSVGCIEPKFYKNFMQQVRELGGITDQQYQDLVSNQMNQDEFPEMKRTLEKWFAKHSSKDLDKQFHEKDCCVQKVLTETQALESQFLSSQVVKGNKAKRLMTPIWHELVKECQIRDDIMILPKAKL